MKNQRRSRSKKKYISKQCKSMEQFSDIIFKADITASPIEAFDFSKSGSNEEVGQKIFDKMIKKIIQRKNQQVIVQKQRSVNSEQNTKFCNADLANKCGLLLLMTAVMIFLGVVTPNTILAHRQPEQRYIDTVKNKIPIGIASEQIQQTQTPIQPIVNKESTNKPFQDFKIYVPQQITPEQQKIAIQQQQIHQIDKIFKRKQRTKQFQSDKSLLNNYKSSVDSKFDDSSDQLINKETYLTFPLTEVKRLRSQNDIQNFNNLVTQIQQQTNLPIKLLQITHNIDYQGNLLLDSVQYGKIYQQISSQQSTKTSQIIQKITQKYNYLKNLLIQQKSHYNQKYQFLAASKNKSKFCIVVQNSEQQIIDKYYYRKLDSIFQQQYSQYHAVFIVSNQEQRQQVIDYMKINNIPTQKYMIIEYKKDKKFIQQQQEIEQMVVNNFCAQKQYAIFLDHYQSLIGRQVLGLYNRIYEQQNEVFLVYSDLLRIQQDDQIIVKIRNGEKTVGNSQESALKQQKRSRNIFRNGLVSINLHLLKQRIIQMKNNAQMYQKFNNLSFTQKIHQISHQTDDKHIKQFLSQKRVKYS